MAAYDLPIWLHPVPRRGRPRLRRGDALAVSKSGGRSAGRTRRARRWRGWCSPACSTAIPELKIITHHMGAMAPYFEGRIGPGWDQLGVRTSDEDYAAVLRRLHKRPLDYFRMFYADTALFGAYDATVCGLEFFGADHVAVCLRCAVRSGAGPMYIRETIAIIDRLPISTDEREQIYWRNATALLKLPG